MQCPHCGASVQGDGRFCPQCGKPFANVMTDEPPRVPPRKRHVVRWVFATFVVVAIAAFALAAVGVIPRFWTFVFPSGESAKQAAHDQWEVADEESGIQVPDGDLTGVDPESVRRTLEEAGFTDVEIEWRYAFDVYGDEERDGRVDRTVVKDGTDLEVGEHLKESTPIIITALRAPSKDGVHDRMGDATNIQTRLSDDPTWFDGTWRGTQVEAANTDFNTSKCDADTRSDMMPEVVISDANGTALTLRANVKALMHYHNNDKPRTYDSDDDEFEDVGRLNGSGTIVMGHGEAYHRKVLYQELTDITRQETDEEGNKNEVKHNVSLYLALNSDLNGDMSDEEIADILDEILGDDVSKEFEDEEEALDAFQTALEKSDHIWMMLAVLQNHGDVWGGDVVEGYRLQKESSTTSTAAEE